MTKGEHSEESSEEEYYEENRKSTAASRQSTRSSKSARSQSGASQSSFVSLRSERSSSGHNYSEDLPQYLKDRIQVTFVHPLEPKHECPGCDEVLRYPIAFEECGHRVCAHCFDANDESKCPVDQKDVDKDEAAPDENIYKEVSSLQVKCVTGDWCKWQGEFQQLPEHMDVCDYLEVSCSNNCGAKFQRKETQKHIEKTCPKKIVGCTYCEERFLREDQKEHLQECLRLPLPCPNKCDKSITIPREELDKHIEEICPRTKVQCAYEEIGCQETYRRDALEKHNKNGVVNHVKLIYDLAMENKKRLEEHETTLTEHVGLIDEVNSKISYLERIAHNSVIWRVDNYRKTKAEGASLSSPTFYTSKHGYRLCAMTTLCGDGKGKGTHISVFISILKGAYDGLLGWPFDYEIELTLLDQDDSKTKHHLKYSLKPNPCKENAPFLGRPRAQKNASFGCSKFITHEEAEGKKFIKDDTIFLKIVVKCDADSEP